MIHFISHVLWQESMFLNRDISLKLYSRIQLCEDLRKLLINHSSDCDQVIRNCFVDEKAMDLPAWWTSDHDIGLCHASFRAGIGGFGDISVEPSLQWVYDLFKEHVTSLPSLETLLTRLDAIVERCRAHYQAIVSWQTIPIGDARTRVVKSPLIDPPRLVVYRSANPPHSIIFPVRLLIW
jgi:hypothetical protein